MKDSKINSVGTQNVYDFISNKEADHPVFAHSPAGDQRISDFCSYPHQDFVVKAALRDVKVIKLDPYKKAETFNPLETNPFDLLTDEARKEVFEHKLLRLLSLAQVLTGDNFTQKEKDAFTECFKEATHNYTKSTNLLELCAILRARESQSDNTLSKVHTVFNRML